MCWATKCQSIWYSFLCFSSARFKAPQGGDRFGLPTGLSIGQRHSECLLSKLSEEVYPDYLLCENQYWGKRKCLCSDKACVPDSGHMPWARDKKWEGGQQSGTGRVKGPSLTGADGTIRGGQETWDLGKDGRDILRVDWLLASLTSRPTGFPHLKERKKQGRGRQALSGFKGHLEAVGETSQSGCVRGRAGIWLWETLRADGGFEGTSRKMEEK